jgi:predicted peroxiredoxin
MATRVLAIVESAYRATVEEQDDTILWLTHMVHKSGVDQTVLLRSNAVNYIVRGQEVKGLTFGKRTMQRGPDLEGDLAKLMEIGVPVYYVEEDAKALGIPSDRIVEGAKPISGKELPGLFDGFEQIWHW